MASRIAARKPARFIPLDDRYETDFSPRAEIPVSSANIAHSRWGHYRAELISIDPVYNNAYAVGGPPEKEMYAWTYRTLKTRASIFLEDGVDNDGEHYEFVFYTNTVLGDPIASLTAHVRDLLGESPDPEVWERVGLSKLIGSGAIIYIEFDKHLVPSKSNSLSWFGQEDYARLGQHMTRITRNLLIPPLPKPSVLQAIADAKVAMAEELKPVKKLPAACLNLS